MRTPRTLIALAAVAALTALTPAVASAKPHDPTPPTSPTRGACAYTPMEDQTYSTWVGLPQDPRHTPDRGTTTITLRTNHGDIPMVLDRAMAPCTVQSFSFLTKRKYFDDTICHRLTSYTTPPAALSVLQCGDPLGTGWGDPGYSFKDELDSAKALENWPGFPDGSRKVYPRGTLAMANAGPDTNGSQFFLVYRDSRLRPDYTVFGHVTEAGLQVLDRIAAGGIDPGTEGTPEDGAPALRTEIERATFGAGHGHGHGH
ncbi:peptidyl-prolyl cis-trans isomerase B (cyclophilin B) [Pedococcus dokdonensis]|uniref:Peptidyl-prolyl cis-trans isomerase n=1 Tax=Pedococcus dokdonensis TaxID=443156 RepID=A0A1H0TU13_9MICO|nr:peptidylprolyl isomerase [Pedococcus dokdonensis]SDP57381.1 peptidyl-prolyl cis-trans isomerase B (cyclophilin B) [Pedococcus dokdonensis]